MTKKTTLISILAVALLMVGILAVYAPLLPGWLGGQSTLVADGAKMTYVSDLDFWQRTPREEVLPIPLPVPRPTRLGALTDPGAGDNSCSFMMHVLLP